MVNPRFASHAIGKGPIVIELWLDYICPFSAKIFYEVYDKVIPAAEEKYPGKFQWVFQNQPQPWHGQGTWVHEAGIAVGLIEPSKFWEFSKVLFKESEDFYDLNTKDKSRTEIVGKLADLAQQVNVDKEKVADLLTIQSPDGALNGGSKVTNDLKSFIRVGRQNGIHVTPTVVINGLQDPSISSSWTAEQWFQKLDSTVRTSSL